jgi:hypothetical protein
MVGLFVLAMAGLSILGAVNQDRLHLHDELLTRKAELIVERGALRSQAEAIAGAAAVGTWARAHGMVAALDNESVIEVAPAVAPALPATPTGLEVETRWQ